MRQWGTNHSKVFILLYTTGIIDVTDCTGLTAPSLRIADKDEHKHLLLELFNGTDEYARENGMTTTPRNWAHDIELMFSYGLLFILEREGAVLVAGHIGNLDAKTQRELPQNYGYLSRFYAHQDVLRAKQNQGPPHLLGMGKLFREKVEEHLKERTSMDTVILHCDYVNRHQLYQSYKNSGYKQTDVIISNNVEFARMEKLL